MAKDPFEAMIEAAQGYASKELETSPYMVGIKSIGGAQYNFDDPWANVAASLAQNLGVGALTAGARNQYDANVNDAYRELASVLAGGNTSNQALAPYANQVRIAAASDALERQRKLEDDQARVFQTMANTLFREGVRGEMDPSNRTLRAAGIPVENYAFNKLGEMGGIKLNRGEAVRSPDSPEAPTIEDIRAQISKESASDAPAKPLTFQSALQKFKDPTLAKMALEESMAKDKAAREKTDTVFSRERSLRSDFESNPAIKELALAGDALLQLESATKAANSGEGVADAQILYKAVNVIDPGAVVRGEDINSILRNVSTSEKLKAQAKNVVSGGSFTPEVRKELLNIAKRAYQAKVIMTGPVEERYRQMAQEYELNPDRVAQRSLLQMPGGSVPTGSIVEQRKAQILGRSGAQVPPPPPPPAQAMPTPVPPPFPGGY